MGQPHLRAISLATNKHMGGECMVIQRPHSLLEGRGVAGPVYAAGMCYTASPGAGTKPQFLKER